MAIKTALITGCTGQDAAYLINFLLDKGYEVHGIKRRSSYRNTQRIDHLFDNPRLKLHYGDMTDATSLHRTISEIEPDEIYNLAAQSHVMVSFEEPEYTANADAIGPLRILEAIKNLGLERKTRFYQASTSEMFGNSPAPQNEKTPFNPVSPYGAAKLYAYQITNIYREAYGIFACNGILFNHESPLRGETFVTRKITRGLARLMVGLDNQPVLLGNLDARRDWGHAKDYIEAMWLMLQQPKPKDYVIASGNTHSVREFIEATTKELNLDFRWKGQEMSEKAVDTLTGRTIIALDPRLIRPLDVENLCGDASLAKNELGWLPRYSFDELVAEMVKEDLKLATAEKNMARELVAA